MWCLTFFVLFLGRLNPEKGLWYNVSVNSRVYVENRLFTFLIEKNLQEEREGNYKVSGEELCLHLS